MNKMPAGAIASEVELKALIKRAKKGERINLYWADEIQVEGTKDRFRLKPDLIVRPYPGKPDWLALDSLALHIALTPGHGIADYVFSNYWYAMAWRHTYLKSKGQLYEHC